MYDWCVHQYTSAVQCSSAFQLFTLVYYQAGGFKWVPWKLLSGRASISLDEVLTTTVNHRCNQLLYLRIKTTA